MSFVEIHPENPQTRLVDRVVDVLNSDRFGLRARVCTGK